MRWNSNTGSERNAYRIDGTGAKEFLRLPDDPSGLATTTPIDATESAALACWLDPPTEKL